MSRRAFVAISGVAALALPLLIPTIGWAAEPTPPRPPKITKASKVQKVNLKDDRDTDTIVVSFDKDQADPKKAAAAAVEAAAKEVAGAKVVKVSPVTDDTVAVTLDKTLSVKKIGLIGSATEEVPGVHSTEASAWATPDTGDWADPDSADIYYGYQWNISKAVIGTNYSANADTAWDSTMGRGIRIGVIDTGIIPHPDLTGSSTSIVGGNVIAGYDFLSDATVAGDGNGRDSNPTDPGDWCPSRGRSSSWHGTHVAGIAAAIGNNARGIIGVAPKAQVQPLRALGHCGGNSPDTAAAILWGAGLKVSGLPLNPTPVQVLNLSLGGLGTCPAVVQSAVNAAVNKGVSVVVSAGNNNYPVSSQWPANCSNVIRVAATGPTGYKADYSNYGTSSMGVTLAAPGGTSAGCASGSSTAWKYCILSAANNGTTTRSGPGYRFYVGTSQAAPHVAAVIAEIKAMNRSLSVARIAAILRATATSAPCGSACGAGIVNGGLAVKQASYTVVKALDRPTITGTAKVGKTLRVKASGASKAHYKYRWLRNGKAIKGATKSYYKLTKASKGKRISVRVTAWYNDLSYRRNSVAVSVR